MVNVLELAFDLSRPNYPTVGIVVDGHDTLDDGDHPRGHDPEGLLDTGALLPREIPHRVALYGCGCGEFGCSTLTALVARRATTIVWTDLVEENTVLFDSALPYGELPDPLAVGRVTPPSTDGELVFDASTYLATVEKAMADRSWETRARAVARLMRSHLGWRTGENGTVLAWTEEDDSVAVNVRLDGDWTTYLVPIPDGTPEHAATTLTTALQARPDPRQLPGARRLHI